MAWSTEYLTILHSKTEEWLNSKGQSDNRAKLIKLVAQEIKQQNKDTDSEAPVPTDLSKACYPTHKLGA
jgi:hypothetical protein